MKTATEEIDTLPATQSRSLITLNADMLALQDLLAEIGGDVSDENVAKAIDEWFGEFKMETARKADAYVGLIREFELRAEARAAEAKRMTERANVDRNAAKNMRDRLKWFMEQHGLETIDTERFRLTVRANGGKAPMEITSEADVPPEYQVPVMTIDKDKLRADLEAGKTVPGATLLQRGTSLLIK